MVEIRSAIGDARQDQLATLPINRIRIVRNCGVGKMARGSPAGSARGCVDGAGGCVGSVSCDRGVGGMSGIRGRASSVGGCAIGGVVIIGGRSRTGKFPAASAAWAALRISAPRVGYLAATQGAAAARKIGRMISRPAFRNPSPRGPGINASTGKTRSAARAATTTATSRGCRSSHRSTSARVEKSFNSKPVLCAARHVSAIVEPMRIAV